MNAIEIADNVTVLVNHFDFHNLFRPQCVTLDGGGNWSANLPRRLVLSLHVNDGSLTLRISKLTYDSPAPKIQWWVQNAMVDSILGISIVLQSNLGDLLTLTGSSIGVEEGQSAKGNWCSSLFPQEGRWVATPDGHPEKLPEYLWWTFLLDSPSSSFIKRTLIFGFQSVENGGDYTYEQIAAFPPNWTAQFLSPDANGIRILVEGPDHKKHCMVSGSFSGGIGQLVCQGMWKFVSNETDCAKAPAFWAGQLADEGDGTWTGTSGGPLTLPPAVSPQGTQN